MPKINKICEYCKKEFKVFKSRENLKYCSKDCASKTRRTLIGAIKKCPKCNKEFEPKEKDQKYCSRFCGNENRKKGYKKTCVQCEIKFDTKSWGKNQKFCSQKCWNKYQTGKVTLNKITACICLTCGKKFEGLFSSKYCSKTCVNKSEVVREIKRKRRAMRMNSYVLPVNGNEIYLRDKGKCQLCGRKVNKKYKWPHQMSISLDHIIPLSLNGTHEPKNIQLTHFICNLKKYNKTTEYGEQLRLF